MTVETSATDVELIDEMRDLREEIRTLRDAIDELREHLTYMFNNRKPAAWQQVNRPIKTMSADPAAKHFRVGYELPEGMPVTEDRPAEDSPRKEEGATLDEDPDHSPIELPNDHEAIEPAHDPLGEGLPADGQRTQRTLFSEDSIEPAPLPATDHILELQHADGDVAVYAIDGTWLACEETREEALEEAAMKVTANRNGSSWAPAEIESGRGHLQEHFPKQAAQVGLATAVEVEPESNGDQTVALSQLVEETSPTSPDGWQASDEVAAGDSAQESHAEGVGSLAEPHRPYSLKEYQSFRQQLHAGELTAAQLQEQCGRMMATKEQFIEQLQKDHNAKQLTVLAFRCGCMYAKGNTKPENANAIYRALLGTFALGESISYQPFGGETYESAVEKVIASLTDSQVQAFIEQEAAEDEQHKKALSEPETLDEFRQFVASRGEEQLTDEQLIQYDRLRADQTRSLRAASKPTVVAQLESDRIEDLELTIKEGYHDRQKCKLWIVQLSTRIDGSSFSELKQKAKMLGGWYSSFKKDSRGFQFKEEASAEKFAGLLRGDADRSDELENRKQFKQDKASDNLLQLADSMEQEAEHVLEGDKEKLKNTVRRAEMAAGVRGRAYASQAMAATMRRIAAALQGGEAVYLDGVRTRTHVEQLLYLLRRSKTDHNHQVIYHDEKDERGRPARHQRVCELDERPPDETDIRFAKYPHPTVYRRHLEEVIAKAVNRKGVKQRAAKMRKMIAGSDEYLHFREDYKIEALTEFVSRCRGVGLHVDRIAEELTNYQRMHRMNIHTEPELRCALRELLP